jgi:ABC-type transporter Mla MlaB component
MLRITHLNGEETGLRLEGRLTYAELGVLEDCLARSSASPLQLDLSQLLWADRDGVARLRELERAGAQIAACSPFVAQLLSEESR